MFKKIALAAAIAGLYLLKLALADRGITMDLQTALI